MTTQNILELYEGLPKVLQDLWDPRVFAHKIGWGFSGLEARAREEPENVRLQLEFGRVAFFKGQLNKATDFLTRAFELAESAECSLYGLGAGDVMAECSLGLANIYGLLGVERLEDKWKSTFETLPKHGRRWTRQYVESLPMPANVVSLRDYRARKKT